MPPSRTYTSGHFALELDGHRAGWLPSVSGGAAHADVILEPSGHKHLGPVHYEDLVATCGTGMSRAFYDWVADSSNMTGGAQRHDGAVLSFDFDYKETSRLEFSQGLIAAIGLPALDATSKDPASLTVKIAPEYTRRQAGNGKAVQSIINRPALWLGSNFRLKIDGLEDPCARVSRVGPITITRAIASVSVGEHRDSIHEVGRVSLSDLIVTLPESWATGFYEWFEDFVLRGNNSADQEKNGSLDLLTPNLSSTLFSLRFSNLGIYAITQASNLPGAEIRKVDVKMYCEAIRFSAGAGAVGK